MIVIENLATFSRNSLVAVMVVLVLLIQQAFEVHRYTEATSITFGSPNEQGENSHLTEVIWPELTDDYEEAGCHLVGHRMAVKVPGCIVFTISVNACRGDSLSYSIPIAEDIDLLDLADMQISEQLVSYQVGDHNENDFKHIADDELSIKYLPGRSYESMPYYDGYREVLDADSQQEDEYPRQPSNPELDLDGGSVIEQFSLEEFIMSNSRVLDAADKYYDKIRHQEIAGDLINVGHCCSIDETRDLTFRVRCMNGIQKFLFKSAKSCTCTHCKSL